MDRAEFEALRNMPDKVVRGDIRFTSRRQTNPILQAELVIENSAGIDAKMVVSFNPKVGSKIVNVHVKGLGPICRLCVDGMAHAPAGRSHRHSLQTAECPDKNLPDGVVDRHDLSAKSMRQVFAAFCKMANIRHEGELEAPDDK